MKWIRTLAVTLVLSLCSMAASAVCSSEDLTGYWDYYEAGEDYVVTCSLRISGRTVSLHRFGCSTYGNTSYIGAVSGELSIDSYCHVAGSITINDGESTVTIIKSTLNRSRETIHGVGYGPVIYAPFTLTKFY
jgi:hypothetical protein